MKDLITSFQKTVEVIKNKRQRGKLSDALKKLDSLLKHESLKWNPYLLVLHSELIQRREKTNGGHWTLESAELDLHNAVVLDPSSADAKIELGWFLQNVLDKPKRALPCFEQAIALCRDQLHSAMLGNVECLYDLKGPRTALVELEKVEKVFPASRRVAQLKSDYLNAMRNLRE